MRAGWVILIGLYASTARAQPAPSPPPDQPPYQPPWQAPAAAQAPTPPPAPEKGEWFGYQEIIAVGVFAGLGAWASTADSLSRDNRTGLISLTAAGAFGVGPGIHLLHGNSIGTVRRSGQLISGTGLVCFLGALLIESQNGGSVEWSHVGVATFVGMGAGGLADGLLFAHEERRPGGVALVPMRNGVALAGSF